VTITYSRRVWIRTLFLLIFSLEFFALSLQQKHHTEKELQGKGLSPPVAAPPQTLAAERSAQLLLSSAFSPPFAHAVLRAAQPASALTGHWAFQPEPAKIHFSATHLNVFSRNIWATRNAYEAATYFLFRK
jgi:hypothetical protein